MECLIKRAAYAIFVLTVLPVSVGEPVNAQGIGEMGGLTGLGAGLGAGAAAGMKNVQSGSMKNYQKYLKQADSYYKAAKKLEAKKQPLRASQYYAAFADTRSKMPSGKDAVAMDAYDKAAKLAREAGSKAQADIYEQKAYNLCLKVHGKESAEAQKRKNALDSKFTSK